MKSLSKVQIGMLLRMGFREQEIAFFTADRAQIVISNFLNMNPESKKETIKVLTK